MNRAKERRARRPALVDPNQFYSLEEAAAARDQSRAQLCRDIAENKIATVPDGRRKKILGAEIIRANREAAGLIGSPVAVADFPPDTESVTVSPVDVPSELELSDISVSVDSSQYADRDAHNLEPHFSKHMRAMTAEGLHDKAAIAAELAIRDMRAILQLSYIKQQDGEIQRLRKALEQIRDEGWHGDECQSHAEEVLRSPFVRPPARKRGGG